MTFTELLLAAISLGALWEAYLARCEVRQYRIIARDYKTPEHPQIQPQVTDQKGPTLFPWTKQTNP